MARWRREPTSASQRPTRLCETEMSDVYFEEYIRPATGAELAALEAELGYALPATLRQMFTSFNGGRPTPDRLQDSNLIVNVDQCLPLDDEAKGNIRRVRQRLISRGVIFEYHLPFARDSGGNYFVFDLRSKSALFFLDHEDSQLTPLSIPLERFFQSLHEAPKKPGAAK